MQTSPSKIPLRTNLYQGTHYLHVQTCFEIFYITQGSIMHSVENSEKQKMTVGDGFILAPGVSHSFENGDFCVHRDVRIDVELMRACCDFIDAELYNELIQKRFMLFKMSYNKIIASEENFTSFLRDPNVANRKRHEKMLTIDILSELTRNTLINQNTKDNDFYYRCVDILNNVCTQPDYLQILQNEIGYHKVYLCKKFKQLFGLSVSEYVKDLRLQFAEYHLKTTELPAAKICSMAGIESFSYFNKIFKKAYGATPSQYRKTDKTT